MLMLLLAQPAKVNSTPVAQSKPIVSNGSLKKPGLSSTSYSPNYTKYGNRSREHYGTNIASIFRS